MSVQVIEFTGTEVHRRCNECGTESTYPQGQRPAAERMHKPNCSQLPPKTVPALPR